MAAYPSYSDYLNADEDERVRRKRRPFGDMPGDPIEVPDDIAIGEDYGKPRSSLYHINDTGNNVSIEPFSADGDGVSGRPRRKRTAPSLPSAPPPASFDVGLPPNPYDQQPVRLGGNRQPTETGPPALSLPPAGPPPSPAAGLPPPAPMVTRGREAALGPIPPQQVPPVKLGVPTAGLNRTGRKLAEIEALTKADVASKVRETDWGYEEEPPEQSPSRFRQALMGALQGALAGASQTGTLAGVLGGAATGTAAGAISPRLMLALKRDQDIKRAQTQAKEQLGVEGTLAKVEGEEADTAYRRIKPTLEALEIRRKQEHDEDQLEIQRQAETGRNARAGIAQHGRDLDREARIAAAKIRAAGGGGGGVDAQAAMAGEGRLAGEEATRAESDIKAEMDSLKGDAITGRKSITQKEALWRAEASKRYQAALSNYVQGVDAKPELKDFYEQVKAEDPDFTSGVYEETVRNTEAKEKRLQELTTEMSNVRKEGRAGRAQSGRIAGARAANRGGGKQKSSDGKFHYTVEEVKAAAGDKWEAVLAELKKRNDVVIDE